MSYRHLLLAVDFSETQERAVKRAEDLARRYQADLSIAHVVENLPLMDPSFGPVGSFDGDLLEPMIEAARKRLDELADALGIPEDRRWIEMGSPRTEIVRLARERHVDLIVLGSHGRHGIGLLLGSTASGVLHHAECDVLAVRLANE